MNRPLVFLRWLWFAIFIVSTCSLVLPFVEVLQLPRRYSDYPAEVDGIHLWLMSAAALLCWAATPFVSLSSFLLLPRLVGSAAAA